MRFLETTHLFMGWTVDQWALAISRVGLDGTQEKHAKRCQEHYKRMYNGDPTTAFEGEDPPNYDLALALFEHVNGILLEPLDKDETLDPSYADHTKDDMEYDEAWQNRYGRRGN